MARKSYHGNEEFWRDIEADPRYQVSSLGRVKSKERRVRCGYGSRTVRARIMKPFYANSTGYLQINLTGHSRHSVHRLVAVTFIEKPPDCDVVNHKNGIRDDNRADNLEWTTHSGNHLHSYRELGRKGSHTGKFGSDHHVSKSVVATCMKTGEEKMYECGIDAARKGFDSGSISRCCHGKSAYHKGFYWRFA